MSAPLIRTQVAVPRNDGSVPGRRPGQPIGAGAAPIAPSQPGALGPQHGIWVKLPGVNFPPAGATPVDEIGDANIAAGGNANLLSVVVPDGQRFRLAGIGFGADDESALAFLSWTILAPDPYPGYIAKVAAVGSIRNLTEMFFLIGSSVTVTINGQSSAAAATTYRYICRVRGWFYSETLGEGAS